MRDLGFAPDRAGRYPAASHAEVKLACWMRETGVKHVVAVINNSKGVCADEDQTCDALTSALPPRGYLLEVWSPGKAKPTKLPGGA
ncbi:SCP1.201-like deaminase [Actinokineospora iranica]|uniref:SCP1.201-like deaminase n=1 Tax=Actinokineospora iranica TaxID=1271860 RepID=A0A1G6YRE5_9PSEU|nr:SCP1.201-like deaminase [Actinokineospora iranica]